MSLIISSTSNEWSQQNNHIDDPKDSGRRSFTNNNMDQKVAIFSQQQQQQKASNNNNNQEPMRCPRCDSSNTKFCYYNNYSLSQPRHFCKACKRYWTRGGTLRNVPVGGGCRKNKRVKRGNNNNINNINNNNSCSSNTNTSNNNNNNNNNINTNNLHDGSVDSLPSTNNNMSFYGLLPTNHSDQNLMYFPFSRYDLQNPPQINSLGLGFSSGLIHNISGNEFRNELSINLHNNNNNNNNKVNFQDLISSNTSTISNSTTPPTISSLLGSTTFQMKSGANNFQTTMPSSYEDSSLHMKGSGGFGGLFSKDVKMELEGQNRAFDYPWSAPSQNQMDHNIVSSTSSPDPSSIWVNGPNLGAWIDSSNNHLGSSIPSLI